MHILSTAVCLPLVLCAQAPAPALPGQSTDWEVVEVPLEAGGTLPVDRGIVEAPVVRSQADSGKLQVEFHRFRGAEGTEGCPPIFLLMGGPGFPGLRAPLRRSGFYEARIEPLTRIADVVVVGQRGIGSSTPNTVCQGHERIPLDRAVPEEEVRSAVVAGVRACREHWEGQGLDLQGFTVLEAAGDVLDVADALDYGQITLLGTSFGSHWAMAIMRQSPQRVARALLGGIEGPDHTYDMPSFVLRALERIAASAEKAPGLTEALPEAGLLGGFRAALARLEAEPQTLELGRASLYLDAARLRELATGFTGQTSSREGIRTWPKDMIALANGEWDAAGRAVLQRNFFPRLPTASFFGLDCGSGISAERHAELLADPAAAVVGPLGEFYDWTCPVFDNDLGDEFRTEFSTEVPTLLVQGTWDTSTPFENALEMEPAFTRGQLVVVEGGSHGALGEARRASPEFEAGVNRFLRTGETDGVPTLVELPPLDWVLPGE